MHFQEDNPAHVAYQAKISRIIARAWSDDEFLEALIANPKDVFAEYDIALPDGGPLIRVVQNSAEESYFVLPKKPDISLLGDNDLAIAAAQLASSEQLVLPSVLAC